MYNYREVRLLLRFSPFMGNNNPQVPKECRSCLLLIAIWHKNMQINLCNFTNKDHNLNQISCQSRPYKT